MKLDPDTDTEPVARWHRYYADETGSVRAGVFESKPITTELQPHSSNEFMHIMEGAVTIIDQKGYEETFRAGDSLILPKGMPHIWKQTEPLRKVYFSFDDPSEKEPIDPEELKAIRIDPTIPLTEIPVDPSRIERGTPTWYVHNCFSNMTGRMNVGIFATTEFHESPWKVDSPELMHILEGSVTFTNGAGVQMTFNAGDTLISLPGMTIKWDSEVYAKKIYCSVGVGH